MAWHRLTRGPYSGRTLPEVVFEVQDLDYVLDGLESGEFSGAVRDEAEELRRRAARLPVPPDPDGEPEVVVCYYVHPDRTYAGLAIVPASSPKRAEYERSAAACTQGYFDLTVLRRIARRDALGARRLMQAFEHHCLGARTTLGRFVEQSGGAPRG